MSTVLMQVCVTARKPLSTKVHDPHPFGVKIITIPGDCIAWIDFPLTCCFVLYSDTGRIWLRQWPRQLIWRLCCRTGVVCVLLNASIRLAAAMPAGCFPAPNFWRHSPGAINKSLAASQQGTTGAQSFGEGDITDFHGKGQTWTAHPGYGCCEDTCAIR